MGDVCEPRFDYIEIFPVTAPRQKNLGNYPLLLWAIDRTLIQNALAWPSSSSMWPKLGKSGSICWNISPQTGKQKDKNVWSWPDS